MNPLFCFDYSNPCEDSPRVPFSPPPFDEYGDDDYPEEVLAKWADDGGPTHE